MSGRSGPSPAIGSSPLPPVARVEGISKNHGGVAAGLRGRAATDAYTYLHLLLVGGIVIAALGLEVAMAHIESSESLGLFDAVALCGGVACYLVGTAAFARRLLGTWNVVRLTIATISVALVPVISLLAPLGALACVVSLLVALFVAERVPTARAG